MSDIVVAIKALPKLITFTPAEEKEVDSAQMELCTLFAEEYKKYLMEFGAILADGTELTGISKSKNRDVVTVTKRERELNPNVPRKLYVIENLGIEGIVIWQDSSGTIYQSVTGEAPRKIAASLYDYLMKL